MSENPIRSSLVPILEWKYQRLRLIRNNHRAQPTKKLFCRTSIRAESYKSESKEVGRKELLKICHLARSMRYLLRGTDDYDGSSKDYLPS
jgi:hypothetical protein